MGVIPPKMTDSANKDIMKEDSDNEVDARKKEKLQKYESTIRRRVECEERAFHIVNKLIYDCVEPQYLTECGKLISKDNYGDIVEERAISKLCGYPLCDKEITNVPKQKYHISTRSNKVFDITERKNFCSNQCLKASKAFQLQIPESPVWARENELPPEFTLLPHKSVKGIIGTEVVGEPPWRFLEDEIKNLKELDSKTTLYPERSKKLNDEEKPYKNKSYAINTVPLEEKAYSGNKTGALSKNTTSNVISDLENLSVGESVEETESVQESFPHSHKVQLISNKKERNCSLEPSTGLDSTEAKSKEIQAENEKKNASPLDRLNALLAKKKHILSGMVDIQEVASTNVCSKETVETLKRDNESHSPTASSSHQTLLCGSSDSISNSKILSDPPKNSLSSNFSVQTEDFAESKLQKRRKDKTLDRQYPLDRTCEVLKLWVTDNTKQYLKEPSSDTRADVNNAGFSNPAVQSHYMDICKRLELHEQSMKDNLEKLTDQKESDASANLRSLPDYKYLKEESEGFQLKVSEFITGKRIKDKKTTDEKETMDSDPVYLPTVDTYDQTMIRAKIVLDRLDKTFPELLGPMALTMQEISTDLRELVYSFRLERDNIVFKPSEWTLVALILLKMLALKICVVDTAFKKETTLNYLNILLKGIGHSHQDLHEAVDHLLQ